MTDSDVLKGEIVKLIYSRRTSPYDEDGTPSQRRVVAYDVCVITPRSRSGEVLTVNSSNEFECSVGDIIYFKRSPKSVSEYVSEHFKRAGLDLSRYHR